MSEINQEKDEFELKLDRSLEILKSCQSEKSLNSCLNCDEIFECKTRKEYVDSVYNSMSKGKVGGFDF